MALSITLSTCAQSLIGSMLAKMLKERNPNITIKVKDNCPVIHKYAEAIINATEAILSTKRCPQFGGLNPHIIFKLIS